mmetsp:Transcript_38930/g.61651  ORF Transcript_38930/g.61651 Transcript_38930/m.61651 type:complete len:107 (-) Transcript_38930:42-362(-)
MSAQESGPCAEAALKWRHCLKTFDYGPDRENDDCDSERQTFYSCIRDFRSEKGFSADTQNIAAIPQECENVNSEFHSCMQIHSFSVDHCRKQMDKLRTCYERYSKK